MRQRSRGRTSEDWHNHPGEGIRIVMLKRDDQSVPTGEGDAWEEEEELRDKAWLASGCWRTGKASLRG